MVQIYHTFMFFRFNIIIDPNQYFDLLRQRINRKRNKCIEIRYCGLIPSYLNRLVHQKWDYYTIPSNNTLSPILTRSIPAAYFC